MRPILTKLRPKNGISYFLHLGLVLVLPAAVFVLIQLNFVQLALSIVVLSKWRMFAVRPRFWPANIRANSVDLMVGLSIVLFMAQSGSTMVELIWVALYAIWLVAVKPASGIPMITVQAFIAQLAALSALFLTWADAPIFALTLLSGTVCYLSARHFLDAYDEPYARMLSLVWGYFGAAMAWLLSHWMLFYGGLAQVTLLLCTLGYGMAVLYYLDHNDRLSKGARRQFVFIMLAIVLVVLAFSDWGDKVI